MVEAPRRVEVEETKEKDSFFKDLSKAFLTGAASGVAKGGALALSQELINVPLQQRKDAQEMKEANFLSQEAIADDDRANRIAFSLVNDIKAAELQQQNFGLTKIEARADMPHVKEAARNLLRQNDAFKSEAYTDAELDQISQPFRRDMMIKHNDDYDTFLKQARGIQDPNSLRLSLRQNYRKTNGLLRGSFFKARAALNKLSPEELALRMYNESEQAQRSLQAREAMDDLNAAKQGTKTLRALLSLTRDDVPDELYKTTEKKITLQAINNGFQEVETLVVTDEAGKIKDTISRVIPGTFTPVINSSNFIDNNLYSTITKSGITKGASDKLIKNAKAQVTKEIGLVRNTASGKLEEFDVMKAHQYTGDDGLEAQNIYLKQLSRFAGLKSSYVDFDEEKAKAFKAATDAQLNYQLTFGSLTNAYNQYTRVNPNKPGEFIAIDPDSGQDLKDQNSDIAQRYIQQRLAAQAEFGNIKRLHLANAQAQTGLKAGYITIKEVPRTFTIAGPEGETQSLTLPQIVAMPIGATRIVDGENVFPETMSEEERNRSLRLFKAWKLDDMRYGDDVSDIKIPAPQGFSQASEEITEDKVAEVKGITKAPVQRPFTQSFTRETFENQVKNFNDLVDLVVDYQAPVGSINPKTNKPYTNTARGLLKNQYRRDGVPNRLIEEARQQQRLSLLAERNTGRA